MHGLDVFGERMMNEKAEALRKRNMIGSWGVLMDKGADEIERLKAEVEHPESSTCPILIQAAEMKAEVERLESKNQQLSVALSFMNCAIDPALSDETDDWELTDVRWRIRVDELHADIERLRRALVEIAKGEGAFSRDPLEHAGNCIDNMKQIAEAALRKAIEAANLGPEVTP